MSTRVAVVDDHPIFRDGLAALVDATPDLELAGVAADGPEIVRLCTEEAVDVVLMDLSLPTMSGIDATAHIAARPQAPAILVVTMVDDDDTVVAALRAGARGYVLKGAPGDAIIAAIRTVAAGGAVFGAGVAGQVLALTNGLPNPAPMPQADDLTERERQVLELLAEGMSNAQIARRLNLSLKTVQNYISRILEKLQVADRTQAALRARDRRPR